MHAPAPFTISMCGPPDSSTLSISTTSGDDTAIFFFKSSLALAICGKKLRALCRTATQELNECVK